MTLLYIYYNFVSNFLHLFIYLFIYLFVYPLICVIISIVFHLCFNIPFYFIPIYSFQNSFSPFQVRKIRPIFLRISTIYRFTVQTVRLVMQKTYSKNIIWTRIMMTSLHQVRAFFNLLLLNELILNTIYVCCFSLITLNCMKKIDLNVSCQLSKLRISGF